VIHGALEVMVHALGMTFLEYNPCGGIRILRHASRRMQVSPQLRRALGAIRDVSAKSLFESEAERVLKFQRHFSGTTGENFVSRETQLLRMSKFQKQQAEMIDIYPAVKRAVFSRLKNLWGLDPFG